MSTFYTEIIGCPYCGNRAECSVARSINATRSPNYRQAILEGKFQVFKCETCHKTFVVDNPFMYFDYDAKFWIGQFPLDEENSFAEGEKAVIAAYEEACGPKAPAVARQLGQGMQLRVVFGITALREKLLCIEANLDDRILELLKVRLLMLPEGIAYDKTKRIRLVGLDEENLYFSILGNPSQRFRKPPGMAVRREAYQMMVEQTGEWSDFLTNLAGGPYVDLARLHSGPILLTV